MVRTEDILAPLILAQHKIAMASDKHYDDWRRIGYLKSASATLEETRDKINQLVVEWPQNLQGL